MNIQVGVAFDGMLPLPEAVEMARRDMPTATRLVSDDAVEAFTVAGTPAACRRRLEAFVGAGLREPVLVITGSPAHRAQALDLAREFTG